MISPARGGWAAYAGVHIAGAFLLALLAPELLAAQPGPRAAGDAARHRASARRVTQTPFGRPAPPAVTVRGFGELGILWPTAAESTEAILDRRTLRQFGGGARVSWSGGPYVEISLGRIRHEGSRVFVFEGQIFDLGIPTTITEVPLDLTGGYRFVRGPAVGGLAGSSPIDRLVPYAGGGIGRLWYREGNDAAADVEDSTTSYHLVGGLEIGVTRWVTGLVELRYRWAPGILGEGGVSAEFDEDDLGGPSLAFRVAIGR